MSAREGLLLTCDVCGDSIFLPCIRFDSFQDGAVRVPKYEDKPEGWDKRLLFKYGVLCPKCSNRLEDAINAAVDEIKKGVEA